MVSLHAIVLLYKAQLRARPLPELLALLGIAAGVALLFAVQVANKSVTGSFDQLTEGIVGRASLEVAARGPQGFDQKLFHKVKRLPDVETAAPIVERRIAVKGPKGRRPLTLFGFDERLKRMGGKLVTRVAADRDVADLGLFLTEPTAKAIGVAAGKTVTIEVGERTERLPLAGVVSSDEVGSLAQSPVAIAHLGLAQEIAAMPDSITRILVAPAQGRENEARASLKRVSAGKLNVRSSDSEAKLLEDTAAADSQSSALFGAISLVVGILLAYNAMLLTLSARRRIVASLHILGATRKTIVASLVFDALILGLAGSLLGIIFGDILSRYVFNEVPDYLSAAYSIGNQRVIDSQIILLSVAGGTIAALAAAARPAINLLATGSLGAFSKERGESIKSPSSAPNWGLLLGGIALIALFATVSLLLPKLTLVGMAVLILGMAMILPPLINYVLLAATRLAGRTSSAALRVSVGELASAPTRATALAAIGALAMFAILAVTGPARDMERGLGQLQANVYSNADIWISPRLEENPFLAQPFEHAIISKRLKRLSAVDSVWMGRASFLDLDKKRILAFSFSRTVRFPIAPGQIIDGDFELATRRLRQGGWIALTDTLADQRNLKVGDEFSLPAPSGEQRFRLAATTTSYVWPSGVLLLNASDYARAWNTTQVNALMVDIADDTSLIEGKAAIQKAIGTTTPLAVRTINENRAGSVTITRQATARVRQIADMVLAAAVLAVAAAMLGAVWQRRQRLWSLASMGMGSGQLYRTIFYETGAILLVGCLIGMVFGFLGQFFAGRWLHITTAYSVPFEPAWELAFKTLVLAVVLAVLAVILPARFIFSTKRVPTLSQE